LSPASLHILLALASDELHGYGIMLEAARQSNGKYKLGPGTLYDNLRNCWQRGLWRRAVGSPRVKTRDDGITGLQGLDAAYWRKRFPDWKRSYWKPGRFYRGRGRR
jgi:hypothetical protein